MAVGGFPERVVEASRDSGYLSEEQASRAQQDFMKVYAILDSVLPDLTEVCESHQNGCRRIHRMREQIQELKGDKDALEAAQIEFDHAVPHLKAHLNELAAKLDEIRDVLSKTYELKRLGKDLEAHLGMIPASEALHPSVEKIKLLFENKKMLKQVMEGEEEFLLEEEKRARLPEDFEMISSKSCLKTPKAGFKRLVSRRKQVRFNIEPEVRVIPEKLKTNNPKKGENPRARAPFNPKIGEAARIEQNKRREQAAYENAPRVLTLSDELIDRRPAAVAPLI